MKNSVLMKAVTFHTTGGPDVLRYESVSAPTIQQPDEVVVAIKAASVNAADRLVRAGGYPGPGPKLPHVLGRDFSGVVVAAGAEADLKPGEEVYGVCLNTTEGAYAEQIAISCQLVARKPPLLSHAQAASIALAGLTALISLQDTLQLQAGERIFIQGGAGGVGSMAVQVAKYLGAFVATTARSVNHEYVASLGADQIIDYTEQDPALVLKDFNASFDAVGGERREAQSFAVLRPGGRAAFIASGVTAPVASRTDVVSLRPAVGRSRANMDRISALVDEGALRPPEILQIPLAETRRAHAMSEDRHVRGKIVLVP
jgi:NADPH:quinone reductase-like Zn-dependent oxidoreductase